MRRRSPKWMRLVAGGKPIPHWCGGTLHYEFQSFPMMWRATCADCSVEVARCDLKPSKPGPKPESKPRPPDDPIDYGGFFY